jgi:hypothetical protein
MFILYVARVFVVGQFRGGKPLPRGVTDVEHAHLVPADYEEHAIRPATLADDELPDFLPHLVAFRGKFASLGVILQALQRCQEAIEPPCGVLR